MDRTLPEIDALWDYNQPAISEARFCELLAQHPEAPVAWREEVLTQVARTFSLRRSFTQAHEILDGLSCREGRCRVRALLERGRCFNSAGDKEQARPLFVEAMEEATAQGLDGLAVDAAHMVAITHQGAQALAWNQRALAMAQASEQPGARKWLGSLLNNIAWTLHDLGRHQEALEHFEEAVELRRPAGGQAWRVARWSVGRCLRSLGRLTQALEIQEALARENEALGQPGGYNQEELGELHLALDRPEEARPFFARAWGLLSQDAWLVKNEPQRLERLRRLAG